MQWRNTLFQFLHRNRVAVASCYAPFSSLPPLTHLSRTRAQVPLTADMPSCLECARPAPMTRRKPPQAKKRERAANQLPQSVGIIVYCCLVITLLKRGDTYIRSAVWFRTSHVEVCTLNRRQPLPPFVLQVMFCNATQPRAENNWLDERTTDRTRQIITMSF